MKKVLCFLALLLLLDRAKAQEGTSNTFTAAGKTLRLDFCSRTFFRVQVSADGKFAPAESWMLVPQAFAPVAVKRADTKLAYVLRTGALILQVEKSTLRLRVLDSTGTELSSEDVAGAGGFADASGVRCSKRLAADEHFFGFGERMDVLDRRGKQLTLNVGRGKGLPHVIGAYNILEANYCPVPFFMSTRGYGIFFHTAYPTQWDMGNSAADRYSFSASGGALDYYFIYGPTFPAIARAYTGLTGRSPLLPAYGYGLHVGTYSGGTWGHESMTSPQYVIALARRLRALGIPADLLWLDSTWRIFGDVGGKGATSFEWRETFPDPRAMFDSLYALKYAMVGLHLRPRFDNGKKIRLLDTAQRLGFTYPEGKYAGEFVNYFDTAAVRFWWEHGVRRVADAGARFLKTDEGSGFGGLANESNKVGPQGKEIAALHNLYPIAYAKAAYEQFAKYNGIRGLNQTREGYAGIQRYPFIFAGDWPSEWQYFAPVIRAGLNCSISSVGSWAHCMGGFEHNADPELYIRWVQFGMFSPVALVFGMDHPGYKEPWNYGPDALRNFRRYDSLRYSLLPYIYSAAAEQYRSGMPIMRPLVFDYQKDVNTYAVDDQYLFGSSMIVCPVTTKGAASRTVYLPKGDWYDWWTGKKYSGTAYSHVLTPLDTMPVFVKAGAIIPMRDAQLYVGQKTFDTLQLQVFPGADGAFNWYDDDGRTDAYKNGAFSLLPITFREAGTTQRLHMGRPQGSYRSAVRTYDISFRISTAPARILIDGKERSFSSRNGWVRVIIPADYSKDQELELLFGR